MDESFLILDVTDAHNWTPAGFVISCSPLDRPVRVPADKRPTVLQTNRRLAEAEVMRLAGNAPGRNFGLFELTHLSVQVPFVTHVNLNGMALCSRPVSRLLPVGDPEPIPAMPPFPPIDSSLLDQRPHASAIDDRTPF